MHVLVRWRRFIAGLAVLLAVLAPPLLFLPIEIHSANIYDFEAALSDLLPGLLLLLAVFLLAGLLVFFLMPDRWLESLIAVTLGLAFLVWMQGQILVWDYGVLDGRDIEWRGYPVRDAFDLALLLLIPTGAYLLRRWLAQKVVLIAGLLLLIQAVPAAWSVWRAPSIPDIHRFSFDASYKFNFSANRNVVILVLDAFQADVLQEILDEEPEWAGVLDGFTYFRNALAGYAKTYPTFALMLTGRWYENDRPIQEFIEESYTRYSITQELLRRGWRVDLFPHIKRVIHPSSRVASNVVPIVEPETIAQEAGRLADLGLFRITPHRAKRFWINDYRWRFSQVFARVSERLYAPEGAADREPTAEVRHPHAAARFVHEIEASGKADLGHNAFKLYHLMIPHAPFSLDRSLELTRLPSGNEGFVQQSYTALEVLRRFLERLEKLGIYDDTLLFVVSDHGGGEYRSHVYMDGLDLEAQDRGAFGGDVPARHLASGLPLILVKPFANRGRLEISDAPVSLGDVARTVAEFIEIERNYPGENMFELPATAERERRYWFYRFTGWSGEYLPEMTEYAVDGFSWFAGNWQRTGRILEPAAQLGRPRSPEVRLGETIRFRPGSPHESLLTRGWSEPYADGLVWSNALHAEMEIPLHEPVAGPLQVRFDFLPFTARGRITAPKIELKVNDKLRHAWVARGRGWYELEIPEPVVRGSDTLRFTFHFPDAASPADFGYSNDGRTLGIALYGLRIESAMRDDNL